MRGGREREAPVPVWRVARRIGDGRMRGGREREAPAPGWRLAWRLACLVVSALVSGLAGGALADGGLSGGGLADDGLASGRLAGAGLRAESWTTGGLAFSDELGGARLVAASGRGTRADPIVLVEEITGAGPAILKVHNLRNGRELVSPARGFLALSVVLVVANRGPWRWSGFDLELRTTPDDPSVYTDGLSFDQPQTFQRIAKADRFEQTAQEDEPFDRIRFDGGSVDPTQYLRLDFDIIDVNGRPAFYLVQRPIVLLAWDEMLPLAQQTAALDQGRGARKRLR